MARATPGGEGIQLAKVFEALDTRVSGHRDAERLQPPPHDELVLGVHQGLRRWRHVDALGDQLLQQFGRHVLMVECQRVGSRGHLAQGFEVGVQPITKSGVTCAAGSSAAVANTRRLLPERDRGLLSHPGKLATANHRTDERGTLRRAGH